MHLPRLNSFVVGVAFTALAVAAYGTLSGFKLSGGYGEDSPSGKYHLDIYAPSSPTVGGTYAITLIRNADDMVLRRVSLTMAESDSTISVREGEVSLAWDVAETYADVSIDGHTLIRVWIPKERHL